MTTNIRKDLSKLFIFAGKSVSEVLDKRLHNIILSIKILFFIVFVNICINIFILLYFLHMSSDMSSAEYDKPIIKIYINLNSQK